MRTIVRISPLLFAVCLAPAHAQSQPVKIFGLVELSGTGATSGTNFNDGAKLAVAVTASVCCSIRHARHSTPGSA